MMMLNKTLKAEAGRISRNVRLAKRLFKLRARRKSEVYRRRFKKVSAKKVAATPANIWFKTSESRIHAVQLNVVVRRLTEGEGLYEVLYPKASDTVRGKRIRKNGGKLSGGLALLLHELQVGLCACCGEPLGKAFHLDHIEPLALGGKNVASNRQLLHPECLSMKGARSPVEFMRKEFPDRLVQWARETLERRKLLAGL